MCRWRRQAFTSLVATALASCLLLVFAPAGAAQDDPGEAVYSRMCAGCHQPTGAGFPGLYPPLAGNPNVQDAAYLEEVIRNGQSGEIEVLGTTYDGQMPGFANQLTDDEVTAVVDFVQRDFGVAPPPTGEPGQPPPAEDAFPWRLVLLGSAQTVFVVGLIFVLVSRSRKGELTWWTAYGRAILIFLFFVLATTWFPSWLLSRQVVAGVDRWISDLAGSVAWLVPLAAGMVALRWLQKKERI